MATKQLARELGLIRKRSQVSGDNNQKKFGSNQFFAYLIVIDFESTCWREKNHHNQEIIEFPAVLMNATSGQIESEFQTYVQPQEHPILSEFCTELTGIKQNQVEAGVPLRICLSQFSRWLQDLQREKNIVFPNQSTLSAADKPCAFITWSDWDLGVCLQYECKRKQLRKPEVLNSWIDLRATYKQFYNRKPKGLNGALQDLGIEFSGREHSGLDDARNTAYLAWRMITDGCDMKITKSLDRVPRSLNPTVKPSLQNHEDRSSKNTAEMAPGEKMCTANCIPSAKQNLYEKCSIPCNGIIEKTESNVYGNISPVTEQIGRHENKVICQSILPTKTLLNGLSSSILNGSFYNSNSIKHTSTLGSLSFDSTVNTSLVLVSTVVNSVIDVPVQCLNVEAEGTVDMEKSIVLPELDEPIAYDAVILEDEDLTAENSVLDFKNERECCTSSQNVTTSNTVVYRNSDSSLTTLCSVSDKGSANSSLFKVPHVMHGPVLSKRNPENSLFSKSFAARKANNGPEKKKAPSSCNLPKKSCSFRVYEDSGIFTRPTPLSDFTRTSILSSSVNMKSASICLPAKITPPLCKCGCRAKRLYVSNGGPNHGKAFYCCPGGKQKSTVSRKRCEFFKWESALLKENVSVNGSLSLCIPGVRDISNKSNVTPQNKGLVLRPSLRN
uniref:ERI1 exoribonuclease 2 n=1 Tax=Erpetoichthys calabaricus TaxID=27687 RepID=A0A8C4SLH6_ERPCA